MNPTAAILLIGDEILSGRTKDSNGNFLAKRLAELGIDLREIRVVPDEHGVIVAALNAMRVAHTHVFTSGGIGPTHDDITADAVAAAFGVEIGVREDARAILATHYDNPAELNEMRLRMARIPEGATLIDNPISKAPGFSLGNVHVMAGVPVIFEAMVAGLLPTLTGGAALHSVSVRIDKPEGEVAAGLAKIAARHAQLSIGSYPFVSASGFGTNIVARGTEQSMLAAAEAEILTLR